VSITTLDEVLVDAGADIVLLIDYMGIFSKFFVIHQSLLPKLAREMDLQSDKAPRLRR
jgi:hypothetical protein